MELYFISPYIIMDCCLINYRNRFTLLLHLLFLLFSYSFVCYRHNLHHYMEFFRSIREALKSNTLDSLKKCVSEGQNAS